MYIRLATKLQQHFPYLQIVFVVPCHHFSLEFHLHNKISYRRNIYKNKLNILKTKPKHTVLDFQVSGSLQWQQQQFSFNSVLALNYINRYGEYHLELGRFGIFVEPSAREIRCWHIIVMNVNKIHHLHNFLNNHLTPTQNFAHWHTQVHRNRIIAALAKVHVNKL